ncbi:MAG: PaaI family thioesterase [Bacilli bacterium]|nr:PaaI family thioesterase [Bacilli bacterium]
MVDFNDAKRRFDEVEGFIKNNNYRLVSLTDDECVLEATITETSMNPYGMAHGGYIFGLADTTAGVLAAVNGTALTVDSTISYLKPLKTNSAKAVATIDKAGSKISVFTVNVYDSNNVLVAKTTNTYFYIKMDEK